MDKKQENKVDLKKNRFYSIDDDYLGTRMKRFTRKPMISLEELHRRKKHKIEQSVHLLMKKKIVKTIYGNKQEEGGGFG